MNHLKLTDEISIQNLNLKASSNELDNLASILLDLNDQLEAKAKKDYKNNDLDDLFNSIDIKYDQFNYLLTKIEDLRARLDKTISANQRAILDYKTKDSRNSYELKASLKKED